MRAHSDCSIREALFHHGPARVAQSSAEHSASDSLETWAFWRNRTAVIKVVGRCGDGSRAEDQKIAAFGSSYRGRELFSGRCQLRFHLGNLGFEAFEAGASTRQHYHLTIELFPADQIEFAEGTLQQHFELAFHFGFRQRGVAAEEAGGGAAQGVEEVFGREHGKCPGNNGRQCITQCL